MVQYSEPGDTWHLVNTSQAASLRFRLDICHIYKISTTSTNIYNICKICIYNISTQTRAEFCSSYRLRVRAVLGGQLSSVLPLPGQILTKIENPEYYILPGRYIYNISTISTHCDRFQGGGETSRSSHLLGTQVRRILTVESVEWKLRL